MRQERSRGRSATVTCTNFTQGPVLGTELHELLRETKHILLCSLLAKSQHKLYNRPVFKTHEGGKNSQKLTASAASFQARVPPSAWVSSANTMACGDHSTLSCKVHPWLSLYEGMKSRGCDVVLVLVWKCIGLDVIPELLASPGGG